MDVSEVGRSHEQKLAMSNTIATKFVSMRKINYLRVAELRK